MRLPWLDPNDDNQPFPNIDRALRAMRAIAAGTVWINRYGRSGDFIIPTGGFHGSGIGKDLGRQAFEACQRYKSVLIDF